MSCLFFWFHPLPLIPACLRSPTPLDPHLPQIALVKAKALGQLGGPEAEAQALELLAALGQGSPEAQEALGHLHFNVGRIGP